MIFRVGSSHEPHRETRPISSYFHSAKILNGSSNEKDVNCVCGILLLGVHPPKFKTEVSLRLDSKDICLTADRRIFMCQASGLPIY